jgi:hypothetical protein
MKVKSFYPTILFISLLAGCLGVLYYLYAQGLFNQVITVLEAI